MEEDAVRATEGAEIGCDGGVRGVRAPSREARVDVVHVAQSRKQLRAGRDRIGSRRCGARAAVGERELTEKLIEDDAPASTRQSALAAECVVTRYAETGQAHPFEKPHTSRGASASGGGAPRSAISARAAVRAAASAAAACPSRPR